VALTKSSLDVAEALVALLDANKDNLGVARVYLGDQNLVPTYPAIMVQSGPKRRGIATIRQYEIDFRTYISVLHGKIGEAEANEAAVTKLAEDVEDVLHSDRTLGGIVTTQTWVEAVDPGRRIVKSEHIRTTRLTHRATSREVLL
jgi:hypothetical protein